MNDRLYRSRDERMFAGVAGGLGERFDIDPSLVRVLWVVLTVLSGGIFLLIYIVMALVVPEATSRRDHWAGWTPSAAGTPGAVPGWGDPGAGRSSFSAEAPGGPAGSGSWPDPGATTDAAGASPASEPGTTPPSAPPSASAPPRGWGQPSWADERRQRRHERGGGGIIGGIILILIGGYFLLQTFVPEIHLGEFWPVILVIVGAALLIGSVRPGSRTD